MPTRQLPVIKTDDGKQMILDTNLKQLRNVENPHDFIQFASLSELDDWLDIHMVDE